MAVDPAATSTTVATIAERKDSEAKQRSRNLQNNKPARKHKTQAVQVQPQSLLASRKQRPLASVSVRQQSEKKMMRVELCNLVEGCPGRLG